MPAPPTGVRRRLFLLLLLGLMVSGCAEMHYYSQAAGGQLQLISEARPVDDWLADSETSAELAKRLRLAREMRRFASEQLGLPDNDSYAEYADLDRPAVVWSVVAAPPYSLTLKQWCYPIVGCAAYRGWFAREDAERHARQLRAEGLDVHIAAVPAYSTLGWFDDPLLSTFIGWPEHRLAGLIFHELAHQQLYLPGDSTFNESFAEAVEAEGIARWTAHRNKPALMCQAQRDERQWREFVAMVTQTREALAELYAQDLPEDRMQRLKQFIIWELLARYSLFEQRWGGTSGYGHWFGSEINNAKLGLIAVYAERVAAFRTLLTANDDKLPDFYHQARALSALPEAARNAQLDALQRQATATAQHCDQQ